jgi:hypothetical protein
MKWGIAVVGMLAMLALTAPAGAVIHEQVAAYCSGGDHGAINADGFLEPPGITSGDNFAQPVLSDGVVVITATGPVITDANPAKYPAGLDPRTITVADADHPSADHCRALDP